MARSIFFIFAFLFLILPARAGAADYVIDNFEAHIEVQQNARLRITETIVANFSVARHGIVRVIPMDYATGGREVYSHLRVVESSDTYETKRVGNDVEIWLGDEDKTVVGSHEYRLVYEVKNAVVRYPEHDEVYWNVTGGGWDVPIKRVQVTWESPFATVERKECFGQCLETSNGYLGADGLTIVLGLNKDNQLVWPAWWEWWLDRLTWWWRGV